MSGEEDWGVLHGLREIYPEFKNKGLCIDGGSRNMNGSVTYFLGPKVKYIGIDKTGVDETTKEPVGGVDWVGFIHDYPGNEIADMVTSFNTFEHDPYWQKSITRLVELLKPGGLFIFQLVLSGKEHGGIYAEKDHYANMNLGAVRELLNELPVTVLDEIRRDAGSTYPCTVDRFGKVLEVPKSTLCGRDFAYLIGRKNAE